MTIVGDAIDKVVPLKDKKLFVHDTEKGYILYEPVAGNQIPSSYWKEVAIQLMEKVPNEHS